MDKYVKAFKLSTFFLMLLSLLYVKLDAGHKALSEDLWSIQRESVKLCMYSSPKSGLSYGVQLYKNGIDWVNQHPSSGTDDFPTEYRSKADDEWSLFQRLEHNNLDMPWQRVEAQVRYRSLFLNFALNDPSFNKGNLTACSLRFWNWNTGRFPDKHFITFNNDDSFEIGIVSPERPLDIKEARTASIEKLRLLAIKNNIPSDDPARILPAYQYKMKQGIVKMPTFEFDIDFDNALIAVWIGFAIETYLIAFILIRIWSSGERSDEFFILTDASLDNLPTYAKILCRLVQCVYFMFLIAVVWAPVWLVLTRQVYFVDLISDDAVTRVSSTQKILIGFILSLGSVVSTIHLLKIMKKVAPDKTSYKPTAC